MSSTTPSSASAPLSRASWSRTGRRPSGHRRRPPRRPSRGRARKPRDRGPLPEPVRRRCPANRGCSRRPRTCRPARCRAQGRPVPELPSVKLGCAVRRYLHRGRTHVSVSRAGWIQQGQRIEVLAVFLEPVSHFCNMGVIAARVPDLECVAGGNEERFAGDADFFTELG